MAEEKKWNREAEFKLLKKKRDKVKKLMEEVEKKMKDNEKSV